MDVIDRFLEVFIAYIDSGFGLLAGDVAYLTTTLIAIDITLAGLFWALSPNADVIAGLLKKVLYVGFFAFIIGNFPLLADIVFDSFARLGITGGGGTMSPDDLLRPGFIAGVGLEAGQPLLEEIADMLGPVSFFYNFIMIAVMFVAWGVIMAAFFVLAVQLFITILEFKLTTLAGFVLVPFALWNRTSFLAERVLGNVITAGIKLMVLAIVIGIGSTLFGSVTDAFRTGEDVTLAQLMGTVLASIVFFWMGVFAPGIAAGLVTGAPQLGAGSAAGAAAGVAGGTLVAGMGTRAAIGAAASGASGALRAGASMAQAGRSAYALGAVSSGAGGAGAIASGLAGMARAGGDALRRSSSAPANGPRAGSAGDTSRTSTGASAGAGQASSSASSPSPSPSASPSASHGPAWADRMQARQGPDADSGGKSAHGALGNTGQKAEQGASRHVGQAGGMALQSLRDGERGASGASPSLRDADNKERDD
ncbi:P-type conjugative transfer protein TrbL [Parvularcula flava]|uniref:Conjugal transfer protein TrbL n=1 Tax=Aquisalinus luteolus TaxID=1566827 RepID=A0A8J3A0U8_9PROT|nr:P-type conjugative transfer protein TrbL [Aquisalinus luteolus]GGH94419.1 conjugal transfer protein TrbL [Aquisalinus luteolus]